MSTNALNQVYKTAILAVEECAVSAVSIGATSLTLVSTGYMTATPFVIGKKYVLRSDTSPLTVGAIPDAEWVTITATSLAATLSGPGFLITGTVTISGNGSGGGTVNAYPTNPTILTPGVERMIVSADFTCRFKTLSDAPKIDFDDESSRFASGDEGRDISIAGARSAEIDITQKLAWAGVDSSNQPVLPVWGKLMRVMGHLTRPYYNGTIITGYGFLPHTWANEVTGTIWVYNPENGANPASTVYRYCGAHGGNGCSIATGKIGDPYMLTGKFSAAYVGTLELPYSSVPTLTNSATNPPEVLLNNLCNVPAVYGLMIPSALAPTVNCASFATAALANTALNLVGIRFYTADGTDFGDGSLTAAKVAVLGAGSVLAKGDAFTGAMVGSAFAVTYVAGNKEVEISQFSLDFGGTVNPFIDQSTATGNAYYATNDRDPKLSINPYHVKKTMDDIDSVVTNMITGEVTIKSAPTSPHITIELPNAQLLSPSLASREGYVNTARVYRALRNNVGAGATDSTLPDATMYEILIGSRSF